MRWRTLNRPTRTPGCTADFFDRSEKRLRLVEEAAKTAIDLAPQLPEAHLALGFFYKSDQESDKALHEFELALAGRPGDSNVEQAIGELYWFTGQLEDATVHYQRATELEPQRSELYCNHGGVYRMAGVASEAVDHHRHAIELRPDRACPYFCLFYIHLTWDGPARARSFLEEDLSPLVGLEDSPPLDYLWVVIDLVDGNYRQALDRVEARDGDAYSWQQFYYPRSLVAAQIQDLLGRPDDARREYESARRHLEARVRERPGDPRFHSSLGIALAGLGQGDAAINAGRQAVTLLPVERDLFVGPYRLKDMAQIYLMVGRPEEALDALELLFEAPSQIHLPEIHLDPMWAELRGRPRFEALRSPANPLTAG
jgi:tetratricopeptide (TPR) repeat protein